MSVGDAHRPAMHSASTLAAISLQPLLAGLLLAQRVGLAQRSFGGGADLVDHGLVLGRRLPVPQRLAGLLDQLVDHADRGLLLLVAEHDGAQHHFLRQLVGFRLDHQHGGSVPATTRLSAEVVELGLGRVEDELAVDVADARGGDRAVERDAGQRQRRRRADHRRDVGVDLGIDRHHGRDDLDLVVEAVGEQRADRPVDQAAGQHLLLGRAALALEEAAGDLARGVGLLLVVDGEREEVLAGLRFAAGHGGDEHDGVVEARHHGAAGLAGDFTGFERQGVTAVGDRFLDGVHVVLGSWK